MDDAPDFYHRLGEMATHTHPSAQQALLSVVLEFNRRRCSACGGPGRTVTQWPNGAPLNRRLECRDCGQRWTIAV